MGEAISLVRASERTTDTVQSGGMIREAAFATGAAWAGLVRTSPGMASGWHHHGTYETFIYVLEGRVFLEFGPGGRERVEGGPGDFFRVPAGTIHRESNPAASEGRIVVVRTGTGAPVVNVEGPEPG
ncbi:MAG TPA: cupin domain-containing protein [Candidatus Limnocylindria bacterium]|nr:cupin domain-containing protein [Candidatus Limnocylindria bacterium]